MKYEIKGHCYLHYTLHSYRIHMDTWLISQSENRRKISQCIRTQVIFQKLTLF